METIVSLAKRRGFMFPGSEIYGGLANTYDYGPVGTELLRNIKNLWWKTFVTKRADIVGLDASLISHHKIWEASGHTSSFADAMIDCKQCKLRMRADHVIDDFVKAKNVQLDVDGKQHASAESLSTKQMDEVLEMHKISCPNCKAREWTPVRKFNQLFPVQLGLIEGEGGAGYLRGETAQGMFINFKNIVSTNRVKLPFGIAQLGKSFRNEITPGNSIFRTIEFEQGEIEYFFDPTQSDWNSLYEDWKKAISDFVVHKMGIDEKHLAWREHSDEERSFYSKKTEDLEYTFPFGQKELWGLAYRTDYDLTQHQKYSKKDLTITDPQTNEKIVPHVIEPAVGMTRLMLVALCDAYREEEGRVYLKLDPKIAPVKAAVFPLAANKPQLVEKAQQVYGLLQDGLDGKIMWDDRGNIGKRYLSQDEIGTPFCITIDYQSLEDDTVTVRHRDTTAQERVAIFELSSYLQKQIK